MGPAALRFARTALIGALVLAAAGCGSAPARTGLPRVAASFSPIEQVVAAVGRDLVEVVTIVPPGEEAHEYEPTAQQVQSIEDARFVAYLGGDFQPGVEKAIDALPDSVTRLDLTSGLHLLQLDNGAHDPHVWLDPANMIAMAERVAEQLRTFVDATAIDRNLRDYRDRLTQLDQRLTDGLADCESRVLVTGHRAFAYLAAAYGLEQISVAGISPGEEPSAAALQKVADLATERRVTTIFFEENLPAALSKTVADEVGATTAVLDPIESLSSEQQAKGADYVSLMDANLAALRKGLGCR